MDSIVPISELDGFVSQVLDKIRHGVNEQRLKGLLVEMPETVNFQCEVVFEFQALEVRRTSESAGDDTRSQNETATDTGESTRESNGLTQGLSEHDQTTKTTATYTTDG
jgi:hypothetical protein